MKILESVYLKNVGPFKEAFLPLNKKGITQIRGDNKDSKDITNKTDVNGVGKSLLLRPLPEIIFSSSPKTQDIKSRTKKDMFSDTDTEFGVSLTTDKTYTFSKHTNKKSYDYKILENGKSKDKNTNVRTKGYAENKIRKIFDYSEDEFYSIYFIDSSRTSKLINGTPTERIQFFTNLFRLNDYDSIRKIFSSKLNEAKKSLLVFKEIKSQISDLEKDIKGFDLKKLKLKKDSLKKENKNLVSSYEKLNAKKVKLLNAQSHKEAYTTYIDLAQQLDLTGSVDDQKKKLESIIKEQENNLKLAKKWDYYNTSIKEYKKKKERLQNKLNKKYKDKNSKMVKSSIAVLQDNLKQSKKELDEYTSIEKPDFDFVSYKKLKDKKLENSEVYRESINKIESKCEIYSNVVKSFNKIHGDNCPTCQNKVDHKIITKLKKQYKEKIEKLSKEEKVIRKNLSQAKTYQELFKGYEDFKLQTSKYEKALSEIDTLKLSTKILQDKINELEEAKDTLQNLENLDKPEKPKSESKVKVDSKYYKKCLNCLSTLQTLDSIFDELSLVNYKTLDRDLSKYKKEVKKLSGQIEINSVDLSKVVSKLDLMESNLNRLEVLKEKELKLKQLTEDIPIIEAIIEAYSNKGIKLIIIREVAKMIEKNINQYVSLLYSEPTKFKFEVADDRNFNISICRKVRGKNKEEDIRTLSGAESRAFSFLLPLAILPLIPNERRLNVMVLDEPMANMGEARKDLFVESFIPKLNSIVPHLVILSTDNENYPNADVYTVIKEKGLSTLVKN